MQLDINFYEYIKKFEKYNTFLLNIDLSDIEILTFITTTCKYESNYKPIDESFKYSEHRFKQIFSHEKYLRAKKFLPCKSKKCQEIIADIIYGNRMGNKANEGYLYRGRGYIQITGKDNYKMINNEFINKLNLDFDLLNNPDLLLNKGISTLAIFLFLNKNNINRKNNYNKIEDRFNYMQKLINNRLPKFELEKRYNFFITLLENIV